MIDPATKKPVPPAVTAAIGSAENAYAVWCSIRRATPLDDITDPDVVGLLPMIWTNAVSSHPDDPDAGRLRGIHHHRWTTASIYARVLLDGVDRLDLAGIDVRLAGGITRAARAYPDLGFRPLGDSVVLVPAEQLPTAVAILRAADQHVEPAGVIGGRPTRRPIRWRMPGGANVTVASRPSPWFTDLPQRSTPLEIIGRTVRALVAEDELVAVLSGTATTITPPSSLWIVDAAQLARPGAIDTESLLETISREHLACVVGPRLRFLAEGFGIEFGNGLVDSVARLPRNRRDRILATWAPTTLDSDGVLRHTRRAALRWLVTSRRLPAWQIATAAPRYFR